MQPEFRPWEAIICDRRESALASLNLVEDWKITESWEQRIQTKA